MSMEKGDMGGDSRQSTVDSQQSGSGTVDCRLSTSSIDQVSDARPADAVRTAGGPPDDHGLALDVLERHAAPVARVLTVVAVVAHDEDVALVDDAGAAGLGQGEARPAGQALREVAGQDQRVDPA